MHEKFNDLLQQYIDGDLGDLETIILEEHLAVCQACRRELNQLKLMDWDLKHQPAVEVPPELASFRIKAVRTHLAEAREERRSSSLIEAWRFQQHIIKHTFGFISYNPANRAVTSSVKRTISTLGRAAGKRLAKNNPVFSRFIAGQA